ncbi:hypothetical protein PALS2_204 [Staphylococcus phage PALS_2]|nr:hypothetical protein PALS2_204 [Staphylococcus phage PALS_2]QQO92773.1 hypothetical protein CPT_Madawaska_120 [Staphylococcus phage Madawaska]UAJ16956.1 hypothetical protein UFVDC4_00028 [Staphylococcus phage vB_SauM-UFV_DC4]BDE75598.1 hypothetical protein [Staphylococcus phage S6]
MRKEIRKNESKQLTLQEKWEIDAELYREKNKDKKKIKGPIIGKKVSKEEMERILKGEE